MTFDESGLPPGTLWWFWIDGATFTQAIPSLTVYEPAGAHALQLGSFNGDSVAKITGPHHPGASWVNVTGPSTFHVTFGTNETLQFNASGLTPSLPWQVTITPVAGDPGPLPQTWSTGVPIAYGPLCSNLPGAQCRGAIFDPRANELLVSVAAGANGYVLVYNVTLNGLYGLWYAGPLVAVDPINGTPGAMAYDPVDRAIYVASSAPLNWGELTVISDRSNNVTTTVSLGGSPIRLAFDSVDDELFVENTTALEGATWSMSVINASTNSLAHVILFPTFAEPGGMAYDSVLDQVFVANGVNVSRIYGVNDTFGPYVPVPGATDVAYVDPQSLAVAQGASCTGPGSVTFATAASGTVLQSVSLDRICPSALAYDQPAEELLVGSSNSANAALVSNEPVQLRASITLPGCADICVGPGQLTWDSVTRQFVAAAGDRLVYVNESSGYWNPWADFTVPSGATYHFTVSGPGASFRAGPARGTVHIPSANVTRTIHYRLLTAPVVFNPINLSGAGTSWTVTIVSGSSDLFTYPFSQSLLVGAGPIRLNLPNGTYDWTVNWTGGAVLPASGSVTVTYPSRAQVVAVYAD